MADLIKSRIRTVTTEPASKKDKTLANDLKSSQEYLDEYKALVDNPEYASKVPEDTRQSLKDAISRAEQLYDERATRNDWLEVAQTLGRAVAQFGAAQSGMSNGGSRGRDMSNLNFGPGIDYGARSDRAFREYGQQLKNIDGEDARNRQVTSDENVLRKEGFGRQEDYLKTALRNAQEREGDESRFRRTIEAEEVRSNRDAARRQREGNDDLLKLRLKELDNQEKSLAKQLEAGQSLATQLQQEPDFSKKNAEKLQQKYGQLTGEAGVDLYGALDKFEKEVPRQEPGFFGKLVGSKGSPDKAQTNKTLLDSLGLTSKLDQLKKVREEKQRLLGNQPQQSQPQQKATTPQPQQQQAASGEPTEDQINKYVSMYPTVSKDQAREILRKRLAGGK